MSGKLNRKMHQAIAALLTCATVADAAAQAGISDATLRRWMQRDDFRAELQAASRTLLDDTLARMRAASGRALDALVAALDEPHPPTRVRAALGLIDQAARIAVDDLAARVAALEEETPGHAGRIGSRYGLRGGVEQ